LRLPIESQPENNNVPPIQDIKAALGRVQKHLPETCYNSDVGYFIYFAGVIVMLGYSESVEVKMVNLYRSLSEKDRRRYAVIEADKPAKHHDILENVFEFSNRDTFG
jgi:hypothetical protein